MESFSAALFSFNDIYKKWFGQKYADMSPDYEVSISPEFM